jgi:hypothetical protein
MVWCTLTGDTSSRQSQRPVPKEMYWEKIVHLRVWLTRSVPVRECLLLLLLAITKYHARIVMTRTGVTQTEAKIRKEAIHRKRNTPMRPRL